MKRLSLSASNLFVALPEGKDGFRQFPCAEVVVQTVEPTYLIINNQMVQEQAREIFRFAVDRQVLETFIEDLTKLRDQLAKLEGHFIETQPTLPI